jgi:hypothetical protein
MLYIILIVGSTLLVGLINILFNAFNEPWWVLLLSSIIATISVILVDAIVALIIRHLPSKWFSHEKKIFQVSKREIAFYNFLGIKKWKEKVPELGGFTSFHKNHVSDPNDTQYLERFLLEIDYGWMIHILSVPLGFLIVLLDYKMYMGNGMTIGLSIGLPIAFINGILNLMPAFILRYNFPRLKLLLRRANRHKN